MKDLFKKRVTKSDKKAKKEQYTQKHIRLKQEIISNSKKENGSVQPTSNALQSNGRVDV
jgi:hypothetical protein